MGSAANHNLTGELLGPYRLEEELGRGGMGVVYKARHQDSGEVVALKTLRSVESALCAQMNHEIEALARVRHPGVVRILSHGLHEGSPWMAMELLEAPTLLGYWRSRLAQVPASVLATPEETVTQMASGGFPIDDATGSSFISREGDTRIVWSQGQLDAPSFAHFAPAEAPEGPVIAGGALFEALSILQRLSQTLAYLHGEGILHRDLKPSNVLVRPGGYPVLVDFGLSQAQGEPHREELEFRHVAGTPRYMSPELIHGRDLDARSDLYALGCIMFRLLTGRGPFEAPDMQDVLAAHVHQPPPLLSRFVSHVPERLEALVQSLLLKDPAQRLGYAEDVASALLQLGAQGDFPEQPPRPRPYLYRPGYVGRESQTQRLLSQLKDALQEPTGVRFFCLEGESGVGKTRLLLEVVRQFRHHRAQLLLGRGSPPKGGERAGAPLQTLSQPLQMLAERCQEKGPQETAALFEGRSLLGLYQPGLQNLPGWPADERWEELPPRQAQGRLMRMLALVFGNLGQKQPLLLILDDLQWADALTLQFLLYLLERAPSTPLCVLVAYRREDVGGFRPFFQEHPQVQTMALAPLGQQAIGALVAGMLAHPNPPASFLRFLMDRSQGNPFFVAEYLRAALAQGLLHRDRRTGRWALRGAQVSGEELRELRLPDSLQQLLHQRLQQLTPLARQLGQLLAVYGEDFELSALEDLTGLLGEGERMSALSELLKRRVLEQIGPRMYRFSNDKWREVICDSLSVAEGSQLHRQVAEALERQAFANPAMLALHWERCGEVERACEAYREAASHSTQRSALQEAEEALRSLLRLETKPSRRWRESAFALCRDVLLVNNRHEEMRALLETCLLQAVQDEDLVDQAEAHFWLGEFYRYTSQVSEAREHLTLSRDLFAECELPLKRATCINKLAVIELYQNNYAQAEAYYAEARAISEEHRDEQGVAVAMHSIAGALAEQGHYSEARETYEAALALYRKLEMRRYIGSTLNNLATIRAEEGFYEESFRLSQESVQMRRQIGDRMGELYALNQWSITCMRLSRYGRALELLDAGLEIAQELSDHRGGAYIKSNLAVVYRELGEFARSESFLDACEQGAGRLGDRRLLGYVHLYRGTLWRYQGETSKAHRAVDAAEAIFGELGLDLAVLLCLCERGFLQLMEGEDAHPTFARVEEIAAAHPSLMPCGESGRRRLAFRRALLAHQKGEAPLALGQCLKDLPEAIRAPYIQG